MKMRRGPQNPRGKSKTEEERQSDFRSGVPSGRGGMEGTNPRASLDGSALGWGLWLRQGQERVLARKAGRTRPGAEPFGDAPGRGEVRMLRSEGAPERIEYSRWGPL